MSVLVPKMKRGHGISASADDRKPDLRGRASSLKQTGEYCSAALAVRGILAKL
jgi:hypothetical protein